MNGVPYSFNDALDCLKHDRHNSLDGFPCGGDLLVNPVHDTADNHMDGFKNRLEQIPECLQQRRDKVVNGLPYSCDMIGDLDHATFSNVEHLSLDFVKYSLDPWIVRWEQSLQKALLSDSEKGQYFVKFNVDGLLRGDYASRMQGYATARQNGWMSANDIRELEDMNMLSDEEGGNLYLVNGSFTKLADAGAFANQNSEKEEKTK